MTEEVTDAMRDAIVAAWLAGARAVHDEWARADEGERFYLSRDHEPDFTEAAHDYAASNSPTTNGEAARIPAAPDDAVVFVALKLLEAGSPISPGQVKAIQAALSAIPIPATGEVERLREALGRIAGLNDLSGAPDDEIEAYARGALHECELIASAALTDHTTKGASAVNDPETAKGGE